MDHFDANHEEATVLAVILYTISILSPVLQDIALIGTILVAFGTLFLNRNKYLSEWHKTKLYQRFKKKDDER